MLKGLIGDELKQWIEKMRLLVARQGPLPDNSRFVARECHDYLDFGAADEDRFNEGKWRTVNTSTFLDWLENLGKAFYDKKINGRLRTHDRKIVPQLQDAI